MRELTTQELDLVAGGLNFDSNHSYNIQTSFVASVGIAYGHTALAQADAVGYGTFSQTQTNTSSGSYFYPGYSSSSSASVSS